MGSCALYENGEKEESVVMQCIVLDDARGEGQRSL